MRLSFFLYRLVSLFFLVFLANKVIGLKWEVVWPYMPKFIEAVWITAQLTLLSLVIGFMIALPLALLRVRARPFWAFWLAEGYVAIFRGTPLIVQLYLIYYGLGLEEWVRDSWLWPVLREPYWCALIAMSLNSSAYACEILRGALATEGAGVKEAAMALGLNSRLVIWLIWVPLALRRSIPQYVNEFVFLLHGSAVAGLVTIADVFGVARELNARKYTVYEGMIPAAIFYLILTFGIIYVMRKLEKHYTRHTLR